MADGRKKFIVQLDVYVKGLDDTVKRLSGAVEELKQTDLAKTTIRTDIMDTITRLFSDVEEYRAQIKLQQTELKDNPAMIEWIKNDTKLAAIQAEAEAVNREFLAERHRAAPKPEARAVLFSKIGKGTGLKLDLTPTGKGPEGDDPEDKSKPGF